MSNHNFELEGPGNGFCYAHQSFECAEDDVAWEAVKVKAYKKARLNLDIEPYDPSCQRTAEDMDYLDDYIENNESRSDYIMREEGTYNPLNGHFLCDECYLKAGQPTAPGGWKCP